MQLFSPLWVLVEGGMLMRIEGISKEKFGEELSGLIYNCLAMQDSRAKFFTDIMDTARAYELEEQANRLAHSICLKEGESDLWELPKSFDESAKLPKLTDSCLPPKLWEYLQAVAKYVQVAPEMCVLPMLSVLSMCAGQGSYKLSCQRSHRAAEPVHHDHSRTG